MVSKSLLCSQPDCINCANRCFVDSSTSGTGVFCTVPTSYDLAFASPAFKRVSSNVLNDPDNISAPIHSNSCGSSFLHNTTGALSEKMQSFGSTRGPKSFVRRDHVIPGLK